MSEPERFDVVVLGSGTAGQIPAYAARERGLTVAMVDPYEPGGTCANRGCDAKKPLVNVAHAAHQARRFQGCGLNGDISLDWADMMRFKSSFTDDIPKRTREDLAEAGIAFIQADPRFVSRDHLQAGDRTLSGDRWVIATGRKPRPLNVPGGELAVTSDDFLGLSELPQRICFVGGGYISMEFAFVCAIAGREVVVIEQGDEVLGTFDADLAAVVRESAGDCGIAVKVNHEVSRIERHGDVMRVFATADGDEASFDAELVVNATGRVPAIDTLGLDVAGVTFDESGVCVDQRLRSISREDVWSAGDVASTPGLPLTPVSVIEANHLTANMLDGESQTDHRKQTFPQVAFTLPACAAVGPTEAQAREQYGNIRVKTKRLGDWKLFRQQAESHVAYKFIINEEDDRLLAAHLVGPAAEELINLFATALRMGCVEDQLHCVAMTYPTFAFNLQQSLR